MDTLQEQVQEQVADVAESGGTLTPQSSQLHVATGLLPLGNLPSSRSAESQTDAGEITHTPWGREFKAPFKYCARQPCCCFKVLILDSRSLEP